jgi:hypothetical protein
VKSVLLSKIARPWEVERALDALLPGQSHPWPQLSAAGDPIAYIHVETDGVVQADISGRHYNEDASVSSVLERLRASVGGKISVDL